MGINFVGSIDGRRDEFIEDPRRLGLLKMSWDSGISDIFGYSGGVEAHDVWGRRGKDGAASIKYVCHI